MSKQSVIIVLVIIALSAFIIFQRGPGNEPKQAEPSPSPTKDASVIRNIPEDTSEEALAVKVLLTNKHGWDGDDIAVTVSYNDGEYSSGNIVGKTSVGAGIWFAANVDGKWELVWDGSGIPECEDIENYPDYPADLIPECQNTAEDEIVPR